MVNTGSPPCLGDKACLVGSSLSPNTAAQLYLLSHPFLPPLPCAAPQPTRTVFFSLPSALSPRPHPQCPARPSLFGEAHPDLVCSPHSPDLAPRTLPLGYLSYGLVNCGPQLHPPSTSRGCGQGEAGVRGWPRGILSPILQLPKSSYHSLTREPTEGTLHPPVCIFSTALTTF